MRSGETVDKMKDTTYNKLKEACKGVSGDKTLACENEGSADIEEHGDDAKHELTEACFANLQSTLNVSSVTDVIGNTKTAVADFFTTDGVLDGAKSRFNNVIEGVRNSTVDRLEDATFHASRQNSTEIVGNVSGKSLQDKFIKGRIHAGGIDGVSQTATLSIGLVAALAVGGAVLLVNRRRLLPQGAPNEIASLLFEEHAEQATENPVVVVPGSCE